jgi:hypothetical protein
MKTIEYVMSLIRLIDPTYVSNSAELYVFVTAVKNAFYSINNVSHLAENIPGHIECDIERDIEHDIKPNQNMLDQVFETMKRYLKNTIYIPSNDEINSIWNSSKYNYFTLATLEYYAYTTNSNLYLTNYVDHNMQYFCDEDPYCCNTLAKITAETLGGFKRAVCYTDRPTQVRFYSFQGSHWSEAIDDMWKIITVVHTQLIYAFKNCPKSSLILDDYSFQKMLVRQVCEYLHDPDFVDKLNTHKHVCFTDGVLYDVEMMSYRKTTPEDMISYTVGYSYKDMKNNACTEEKISQFMESVINPIFPDGQADTIFECMSLMSKNNAKSSKPSAITSVDTSHVITIDSNESNESENLYAPYGYKRILLFDKHYDSCGASTYLRLIREMLGDQCFIVPLRDLPYVLSKQISISDSDYQYVQRKIKGRKCIIIDADVWSPHEKIFSHDLIENFITEMGQLDSKILKDVPNIVMFATHDLCTNIVSNPTLSRWVIHHGLVSQFVHEPDPNNSRQRKLDHTMLDRATFNPQLAQCLMNILLG